MASTPEEDSDDDIDGLSEEAGSGPERPESEQECAVSLGVVEIGDQELAEVFAHGELDGEAGVQSERQVLIAHVSADQIIMTPVVAASYRDDFLGPKYRQIRRIRIPGEWEVPKDVYGFDELLEQLPIGFSRHARRGLGLRFEHRLIIEAIEEATDATELLLVEGDAAFISGDTFTLGLRRFERARKALDQIGRRSQRRALEDRRMLAHNEVVHPADAERFPQQERQPQPGEIYKLVQLSLREPTRSQNDRSAATDLVRRDVPQIARENPRALLELRSEIERVTLAQLIERFDENLRRDPDERIWQRFFEEHPFVLAMAFPYPVLLVRGQAHVGGVTMDGRGESIADFLFRQRLTGGVALVEIKTTRTRLRQTNPFRGNVYAAHTELCAAISQVLDQRSELTMNFHARARSPGMEDAHVGHVQCLVIVGRDPDSADKRRSLDLFRHATKDVAVVTFDELLEKLRGIHQLMSPLGAEARGAIRPESADGKAGAVPPAPDAPLAPTAPTE
ncbi:Shedu immune nuclease family protein [Pseudacidovorax intermedius]|uniref:Shedu protein SduA C-terminal domain-containing protein n=1 Tax=Pseudacidovorax intermedius TaxID=433924 RepID=A0A147GS41_9BURK|nr:Shedu immune nuclease family protein [Pseudacidovorax intermedius]KTT18931.1 hypothetical protein NS331_15070 [Pseudacidovorax intermedius]